MNRGRKAKYEKEDFSEYVRNMRNAVGWTQQELAKLMRSTLYMIKSIENGERIPEHADDFLELLRDTVKEELATRRKKKRRKTA